VIQGTAADIVKTATVNINEKLLTREKPLEVWLLLQIHDELVWECKDEDITEFVALIKSCMENIVNMNRPLPIRVYHGKKWGEKIPLV
jgi:DNA polymerase-1